MKEQASKVHTLDCSLQVFELLEYIQCFSDVSRMYPSKGRFHKRELFMCDVVVSSAVKKGDLMRIARSQPVAKIGG